MIDQRWRGREQGIFSYTQKYLIKKKKKRPIASEKKEFLKDRKKDEADKSKSQYSPNITRIPVRFVPQEIDSENLHPPFPLWYPREGEERRKNKGWKNRKRESHHSSGEDNDPFFFFLFLSGRPLGKNGGVVYHASLSTRDFNRLDHGESALRSS